MKRDKTIHVAVAIDVRGESDERCGLGCWAFSGPWCGGEARCDAWARDGERVPLRESKLHPGEYLRCKACMDAEMIPWAS